MVEIEGPPRIGEKGKQLLPHRDHGCSVSVVPLALAASRMYTHLTLPVFAVAVADEGGALVVVEYDNVSLGYDR